MYLYMHIIPFKRINVTVHLTPMAKQQLTEIDWDLLLNKRLLCACWMQVTSPYIITLQQSLFHKMTCRNRQITQGIKWKTNPRTKDFGFYTTLLCPPPRKTRDPFLWTNIYRWLDFKWGMSQYVCSQKCKVVYLKTWRDINS